MKSKTGYRRKAIAVFLLVTISSICAVAQNGSVKGKVSNNGQPVAFASVMITRTKLGATTGNDGEYWIKHIPAGTYKIAVSAIGFETKHITVTINKSAVALLDIMLKEDISKLNEVVVTGVTRRTTIRKSPIPVSVVTKNDMDVNVNNNIIDAVLKEVPGLSALTTGPNISKPFIRGLGYNRVLTMYDGMRQEGQQWGDEHGIEIDQYGIERVEVVKGPASLTYGSDALAGVINMIPHIFKGDDGKITGDAMAEYHTNNGMMGSSVGLFYKKNNWNYAFRVSGKAAHNYQNKIDGYVYGTAFREYNLSGMIGVEKKWGYSRLSATVYDNQQEIPDGSRDSLTRKFTKQIYEAPGDDIKKRPIVPERELKSYTINALHQHIQHYRVYTHSGIKLGNGELKGMVGFQQSTRREYNHPVVPEQPGLFVVLKTYNYDFKYNFPVWHGIEATLGINGMYQGNTSKNATDFPIPDYHLFDAGTYFFVKKSFGKIDMSGGIRYDTRNINWRNFYVRNDATTGFNSQVFLPDTINGYLQFQAFAHQYNGVSGSIGATYNISERLLLKANIARGYRAPNITEIGSNGLDPGAHIVYLGNRTFAPEFSLQEDLGFLAYLPDADIVVELFNNHIENYIYQAKLYDANGQPVVIVQGNTTYKYQQSNAQLFGAELSLNIHPQHIRWLAFNNSLSVMEGLNKNDSLLNKKGNTARYLPFIPPLHTRSELRTTFRERTGVFSKIYARVEMEYYAAQNHFYGLDDTETATQGYILFNVGFGATIRNTFKKDICKLFFQADNLFNAAYQANLNRLKYFEYYTASPNGHSGIYNIGRNISIKVIVPL